MEGFTMNKNRMDNKYIREREMRLRKQKKDRKEIMWGTVGLLTATGIAYFLMCLPSLILNA